jgi:hypothetical protein
VTGKLFHRDMTQSSVLHHNQKCVRGVPIPWPPRPSDFAPLDLSFLEFVKDVSYCEKSQNMNELSDRIISL